MNGATKDLMDFTGAQPGQVKSVSDEGVSDFNFMDQDDPELSCVRELFQGDLTTGGEPVGAATVPKSKGDQPCDPNSNSSSNAIGVNNNLVNSIAGLNLKDEVLIPVSPTALDSDIISISAGDAARINTRFQGMSKEVSELGNRIKKLEALVMASPPNPAQAQAKQPVPLTPVQRRDQLSDAQKNHHKDVSKWGCFKGCFTLIQQKLSKSNLIRLLNGTKIFKKEQQDFLADLKYDSLMNVLCLWYVHLSFRKKASVPHFFPQQYHSMRLNNNELQERVLWLFPELTPSFEVLCNQPQGHVMDKITGQLESLGIFVGQRQNPQQHYTSAGYHPRGRSSYRGVPRGYYSNNYRGRRGARGGFGG